MKKSKIYTKTGDTGETGLVSGTRTLKSDQRIELYGEVDELNSRLGLLGVELSGTELIFLQKLQSALFDLGSNLACEAQKRSEWKLPSLSPQLIQELEGEIDRLDENLPALKQFILPGGSKPSALAHLCRTQCRLVERRLVGFASDSGEALPACSLIFLNRLSDYFFVLARELNRLNGVMDIAWHPRT